MNPRVLMLAAVLLPRLMGAPPSATERELKAVYLFQFSQFVEWPASAFADRSEPFVIGLLGPDQLEDVLHEIVRGERAAGRPIEVRRVATKAEAARCQILYVAPGGVPPPWSGPDHPPVLLVGETEEFLRAGGVMRFHMTGNRVRLHINLPAAQRAGLSVSSKLLRIAAKVEPVP